MRAALSFAAPRPWPRSSQSSSDPTGFRPWRSAPRSPRRCWPGTRRSATSPPRSSAPSCSSAAAWRSGTAAGTAATTPSPTASSSRRWRRCSAPRLVGTLAVVASSYLFDRLVRDRWGEAARWATLWFAAGVVTLLADGQLTFALGVAFGLAALRCLQLRRPAAGAGRRSACALSSPVAAPSWPACCWRGTLAARPPHRTRARDLGRLPGARPRPRPQPRLPRIRPVPLRLLLLLAIPLWCGGALLVTRGLGGEERQLRRVLVAYVLAATVLCAGAEPAGRQRRPARRPLRRPGPGRGHARPPPAPLARLDAAARRWRWPAASTGS